MCSQMCFVAAYVVWWYIDDVLFCRTSYWNTRCCCQVVARVHSRI